MRKSCPYCGRIHDVMYKCPQAKRRQSRNKKRMNMTDTEIQFRGNANAMR